MPVFLRGGRITSGEGVLLILFHVGCLGVLIQTALLQSAIPAPSCVLLPFLLTPVPLQAAAGLEARLRARPRQESARSGQRRWQAVPGA